MSNHEVQKLCFLNVGLRKGRILTPNFDFLIPISLQTLIIQTMNSARSNNLSLNRSREDKLGFENLILWPKKTVLFGHFVARKSKQNPKLV